MSYPGSGDPSHRAYGQYGARPNPSDRVIPPPGYSPEPADPRSTGTLPPSGLPPRPVRAAAQSGGLDAVPPPVFGTGGFHGGPPPQPPKKDSGGLWIVVAVLVAVALIVGGVFAWLVVRDDTPASVASAVASPTSEVADDSAQDPGVTTLPAGAQTCPATVASTGGIRGSAVGSTVTSCPFAEEVRLAYLRGGSDRNTRTVVASSPVTGKRYDMNCVSSAQLITCTGGENAVVYLF
ncbi:hypothetical protein CH275_26580 [Rhodococcus sp. 06-235-1A]|uniref:hypothetical protein n=1 Tax=Rhodococcus sp. 06-235-1A TaxID=2022508 RepID=UPI000B9B7E40|nr:hypothetical protein [Rhodococcus sp. 06-235-1A]OZC96299.1 hypothetical protein CH275_26580 [Rhodococcus sp. 06-235-1A]